MLVSDQTITAPLTTHRVWLVSPVMWSQKLVSGSRVVTRKVGAIVMSDASAAPMKEAIRRHQGPLVTVIRRSSLPGASARCLLSINYWPGVYFQAHWCVMRSQAVRLCEVSPNNYARPAQSQSSRQIPSL